jgi:glycosyltransferase involved in cell wall biosynthesis
MASISIVIPAYNAARFLPATLESVFAQRGTGQVIVVNDGSTDNTREVLEAYRSRTDYVEQANQGVSVARNAGLARVSAPYVIFLDADDTLIDGALDAFREAAEKSASDAVLFGDCLLSETATGTGPLRSRPQFAGPPPVPAQRFFEGGGHPPSAFCISTAVARRVGGFDKRLSYAADLDFLMRCGTIAPFVHVTRPVVRYLQHSEQMSHRLRLAVRDTIEARINYLDWCRKNGHEGLIKPPSDAEVFSRQGLFHFYRREWASLKIVLAMARERGVSSRALSRLRLWRSLPRWLYRVKDQCDQMLYRTKRA